MFKISKLKRFFVIIVVILLIFPNSAVFASPSTNKNQEIDFSSEDIEPYFIYTDSSETIPLYAEPSDKTKDILIEAPNPSKVQLLDDLDSINEEDEEFEFLLVHFEYEAGDSIKEIEGYVHKEFLIDETEMDEILTKNLLESDSHKNSLDTDASEEKGADNELDASEEEIADNELDASEEEDADNELDASEEEDADNELDASEEEDADNELDASEKEIADNELDASEEEDADNELDASEKEIADNELDASEEEDADNELDASEKEIADNELDASEEEDADNELDASEEEDAITTQIQTYSLFSVSSSLQGVALNSRTHVYERTSTGSNILKSYSQGTILKYRSYNTNWYQATVYANGKWQTGYIHKNHVENGDSNPSTLQGVAKNSTTRVYSSTSTSSNVLRTYSAGSLLKYKTFTSNWYQATVYANGKWQTGYIHKNHVENGDSNPSTLQGVAKNSTTRVYSSTSTSSNVLRTYSAGSLLKYKTFTSNWYQATVYANGKWQTGYIHKNHVENGDSNPSTLQGVAKNSTTRVYSSTSTSSSTLKSYSAGSILQYKTFTSNWYQATVYVNGKAQTGYIHKNHVENITSNQQNKTGYAAGNGSSMNVYASPNTSSKVLKSYTNNSSIKYKTFTTNWYQATVYVNGKAHTGYIHKDHVSSTPVGPTVTHNSVAYNYTFKHMVDRQMAGTPKSDGAGNIPATRGEVEFFSNPNNFSPADQEFFQFLVLSGPGGFSAAEINKKILIGAGTLSGKGQAFINAAKQNNINEAYLIAHAMHETGNGKSTLAQGVPVDAKGNVTRNSNGQIAKTSNTKHTVYNMYGYGAPDANPINGGAKYAFDHGWFTPEAAIIGGAGSINTYISRGQDTLYKMRWNPDDPGYPQYATHVRWATGQTKRIYDIYQLVDNYEAVYEIPNFKSIPNTGNVMASALNVRLGPGTNNSSIGSLTNGTQVKIIGSNPNGWYQIEGGNTKGWVSSMYINLKH
ncbi:SH3 domain-containing protein [Oceanobacillus sojae]|uniref:SH3 domain-containing protein n=1 Tax=Oceanobacillus sojae TaxID=582851 RepID=UPI0021A81335|nr:SH3 domain-containing protein [Oceanobacillus sojae]MCT1905335.1 SH3 domain-containing protein [Oceanobacillus sojae]